jgi:hypothetical protein
MAKKPTTPSISTVNAALLSDEDKQKLREKAKQRVETKRRETAEDAFLAEAIRQEELSDKPQDQLEYILIDMAGHAPHIMLDGVQFFHGETYEVTRAQADTMREIIARGWAHEEEIGGANRDLYRKPRNTTLASSGAVRSGPLDQATGRNIQMVVGS